MKKQFTNINKLTIDLATYYNYNYLKFNCSKTYIILFHNNNPTTQDISYLKIENIDDHYK